MAYPGAAAVLTGATTTNDLSRDVYIETLEAFNRTTIFRSLVYTQTIDSGKAGQFIVNGKATAGTDAATYNRGTQVDITDAEMDERTIILARPVYEAKRVDQFEERVAHYDVRSMITNQMGESLANKYDNAVATVLFSDHSANTGVAANPDEVVAINSGSTAAVGAEAKGDAIAEAIFTAKASLEANDDNGEAYCVLSPLDYSYVVQSTKAINADYSTGNGSYNMGTVMEVGGVKILKSNNIPASYTVGITSAVPNGVVFTRQAAGVLELIGLQTNQEKQIDFLDSTLMTAYYAIGTGMLRPESKVVITAAALA